jgi:hypothetical protein
MPGPRIIQDLRWASACARPPGIPLPRRLRGAKRAGLAFQRKFSAALPGGLAEPWFQFEDANGKGYCSPDHIIGWQGQVLVLECKLGNVEEAERQIKYLYGPVLERVYSRPVRGVAVVRHLRPGLPAARIHGALRDALAAPAWPLPVLHWLGQGAVL